jgi:hypothetical protein
VEVVEVVEETIVAEEEEDGKWDPDDMLEELPKREAAVARAEEVVVVRVARVRPRVGLALCGRCFRVGKFVRFGMKLRVSRKAGAAG